MPIVIQGDYNYNHEQVISKVVATIQRNFDINPQLISTWVNEQKFAATLKELDDLCFKNIMSLDNELLKKLLDITHPESFIEEYMPWEREKCGQIIEEFSNGYIKYCNHHRYLHQIETLQTCEIDHYFVAKSPKDIIEEKIFNLRFNLYVDYTRLLAKKLVDTFIQQLDDYAVYLVTEADFNQLLEWLQKHPADFREKYPCYNNQSLQKLVKVYLKNNTDKPLYTLIEPHIQ